MALGISLLAISLVISFAAGFMTRDYISRRRRDETRRWSNYIRSSHPPHANSNLSMPKIASDLGKLLSRYISSPGR
jgi:hypothetical protein